MSSQVFLHSDSFEGDIIQFIPCTLCRIAAHIVYKDICMNIRFGGHGWLHICRTANPGNGVFEIWYGVRGSGVFIRIRLVAAV